MIRFLTVCVAAWLLAPMSAHAFYDCTHALPSNEGYFDRFDDRIGAATCDEPIESYTLGGAQCG